MTSFQGNLRILLVAVASFATASCGFHLRTSFNLPAEIQTLSVTSADQYSNLSREMKQQLRIHDIDIVEPEKNVSNLHLAGESYEESTLSLYQTSRVAEKQFRYSVNYSVTLPEQGSYDFSTSLSRTYLDNPLTALAKSIEVEMLMQEMRIEATKQIMRQLTRLNAHIDEYNKKKIEEQLLQQKYQSVDAQEGQPSLIIETRSKENTKDEKNQ